MQDERLIIFAKAPKAGQVKTRLAKTIGANAATAAYQRLVESLLSNLSAIAGVILRFAPDDCAAEIQAWLRPGWQAQPQGEGDLGCRLQRAFSDHFASGAKRVVIIGSDCPAVQCEDIRQAWKALETHDVALGPASDGGYWLIGLREPRPQLFEGIDWGTDSVLAQTLQRAKAIRLRVELLRILSDVDNEEDWREFLAH